MYNNCIGDYSRQNKGEAVILVVEMKLCWRVSHSIVSL